MIMMMIRQVTYEIRWQKRRGTALDCADLWGPI